jgi:S1-C subfamily serine protease
VRRAHLGIGGQNTGIHRRVVRFYDLPVERGVLTISVEPSSPAAAAGLEVGDVIVAYDGDPIQGIDDLHKILTETRVGIPATLTIIRHDKKLDLVITPREAT